MSTNHLVKADKELARARALMNEAIESLIEAASIAANDDLIIEQQIDAVTQHLSLAKRFLGFTRRNIEGQTGKPRASKEV